MKHLLTSNLVSSLSIASAHRGSFIACQNVLGTGGVLKGDSECEVLCLDITEVNLIAGR